MSEEDYRGLLTPTGELILKEKKLMSLSKGMFEDISCRILHLDLRNNEIRYLESNVLSSLTRLRSLDLRSNKLEVLSDKISHLTHLKSLKLDHNLLSSLPLELFRLPLSLLTLSDNSLFMIPCQISELTSLSTLSIAENQIKSIPDEIADIETLKTLYLHSNEFFTIPSKFYKLVNLEELSLEWFRYTSPPLSKLIKGHIGEGILCGVRDLCLNHFREGVFEVSLESFLKNFSTSDFSLNKVDVRQKTLMHMAVCNGDNGVVRGLIESKCDLDVLDIEGFTPLVLALKEDNVAAAKILVQAGARLDIGGGNYGSVLNLAVIKSEPWLVSTLLKSGTDVNLQDCEGNSCLHHLMTVYRKHKHRNGLIADMLVEHGVRPNLLNAEKWAAVHIAARKGQTSAFRWIFIKNAQMAEKKIEGFDLNLQGGSRGWSPLHVASHSGHYKTVEALVSIGAHVYLRNFDGKTPKDTAKGDLAIYKYLSRVEKKNIGFLIQQKCSSPKRTEENWAEAEENCFKKYQKLYAQFRLNKAEEIEKIVIEENNICVKTDAVYLLSQLKQRKAASVLMATLNTEEQSMVRNEASLALQVIRDLESKANHSHHLIGPKLPRTNPLQMSLPVNVSAYVEEETRIETLLII